MWKNPQCDLGIYSDCGQTKDTSRWSIDWGYSGQKEIHKSAPQWLKTNIFDFFGWNLRISWYFAATSYPIYGEKINLTHSTHAVIVISKLWTQTPWLARNRDFYFSRTSNTPTHWRRHCLSPNGYALDHRNDGLERRHWFSVFLVLCTVF
jgi:hypothetical protein